MSPGAGRAAQRTRQLVAPAPDPQRLLPSLKVEQTSPALQSPSLEHESHSSPVDRQLEAEPATSSATNSSHPVRFMPCAPAVASGL